MDPMGKKMVPTQNISDPFCHLVFEDAGVLSSSFSRKIHHPWRPVHRSPQNHRVAFFGDVSESHDDSLSTGNR